MRTLFPALVLLIASVGNLLGGAHAQTAPRLERRGQATQLIVDDKPFLMLGGELHNSSSSDLAYMAPIWPQMKAMTLNTVLAPVAWETIEPEEGRSDFSNVDGLLTGARDTTCGW